MTEATGGGGRAEVERRLVEKTLEDDAFRRKLLEDPKGTIEQELGKRLPEGVQVRAVEETADTIYLVLLGRRPGRRRALRPGSGVGGRRRYLGLLGLDLRPEYLPIRPVHLRRGLHGLSS